MAAEMHITRKVFRSPEWLDRPGIDVQVGNRYDFVQAVTEDDTSWAIPGTGYQYPGEGRCCGLVPVGAQISYEVLLRQTFEYTEIERPVVPHDKVEEYVGPLLEEILNRGKKIAMDEIILDNIEEGFPARSFASCFDFFVVEDQIVSCATPEAVARALDFQPGARRGELRVTVGLVSADAIPDRGTRHLHEIPDVDNKIRAIVLGHLARQTVEAAAAAEAAN